MGLLGKWFVRVEVDRANVKRDLAQTRQDVVRENQATAAQVNLTWKQFVAQRMGDYMKLEGGHGAAMKRIGAEWQQYKAGATSAVTSVTNSVVTETSRGTQTLNTFFEKSTKSLIKHALSIIAVQKVVETYFRASAAYFKSLDTGEIEAVTGAVNRLTDAIAKNQARIRASKGRQWESIAQAMGLTEEAPSDFGMLAFGGKRPTTFGNLPGDIKGAIGNEKAALSLRIQRAEIENNTAAVAELQRQMAFLEEREAVLNGTGRVQAAVVRQMTLENIGLGAAYRARAAAAEAAKAVEADFVAAVASGSKPSLGAENFTPLDTRLNADFASAVAAGAGKFNFSASLLAPAKTVMQQLAEEYRNNATTMVDAYRSAVMSVEGLFSDVLFAAITGNIDSIDDAFKSFLKNLAREISNFMAQQTVMKLFGAALGGGAGMVTAANGGVLPGGFRAFASGGIVTQPTLGLVGEGDYNEAVVPLPNGRSIPVEMKREQEVVVKITNMLVNDPAAARPSSEEIVNTIATDVLRGGPTYKAIRARK